jgi:hypothetical protein
MSKFLYVLAYVMFSSFIIRVAIIAGWSHDPGYIGPALLVFVAGFILATQLNES